MMSSWTKKLVVRVAIFAAVSGTILGSAWLASGGWRQDESKSSQPPIAAKKPEVVEGSPNQPSAEGLKTDQTGGTTSKEDKAVPTPAANAEKPAAVAEKPEEEVKAQPDKGKEREKKGREKKGRGEREREDERKKMGKPGEKPNGKKPEKDDD